MGKRNSLPSSTLCIGILEKIRLQIIHVRSCELVTGKRDTVEQCSWEFLFCCSRLNLDSLKKQRTLFSNIKEVETIKIHELQSCLYFALPFCSFKILENNIKTSSKRRKKIMKGLLIGLLCHILKQVLNNTLRKSIPAVPKRLRSHFWDISKLKQWLQYLYQLLIHMSTLISFSINRIKVTATLSVTAENQLYYPQWLYALKAGAPPRKLAQSCIHCGIDLGLFVGKTNSLQLPALPAHQQTNLYAEFMPNPPSQAPQMHSWLH